MTHFPLLFDTNFNTTRVETLFLLMNSAGYVDDNTTLLKLHIPVLVYEFGKICLITVEFAPSEAGGWTMDNAVNLVDLQSAKEDKHNPWRYFFSVFFGLCYIYLVVQELYELFRVLRIDGHPLAYFTDVGNMLDLANYINMAVGQLLYYKTLEATEKIVVSDTLHYKAYRDELAVGRLTQADVGLGQFQTLIRNIEGKIF